MRCQYCGDELRLDINRGWVHEEGGPYKQYCPECGWHGSPFPPAAYCPNCGWHEVRDDHVARPVPPKEK